MSCYASRPGKRLLDNENFRRPSHSFSGQFRVGELRILAPEIFFDYPTGSRAGLSNEDWNFQFDYLSKRLAEGRPSDWSNAVGNSRAHEHSRIAG